MAKARAVRGPEPGGGASSAAAMVRPGGPGGGASAGVTGPARPADARREALALDRLVHEKLRLGILAALAGQSPMSFGELKRLLDTTDGNLSVHARKLEEADYLACEKGFEGRIPRTTYRITPAGRKALERYLSHMEALIASVRRA